MNGTALLKAVEFVRDFNPGKPHADAFIVIRGGHIVAEEYWGGANASTIHDIASGTKSIGAIALAHAIHEGHFTVDTNVSKFFPDLKPLNADAVFPQSLAFQ